MTSRLLPQPVPVTVLRVYEPLEAFAVDQRSALAAAAADPDAGRAADEAERRAAWRRLLRRRVVLQAGRPGAPGAPHARVLRAEGTILIAPVAEPDGRPEGPESSQGVDSGDPVRRHTLVRAWQMPVAWVAIVRRDDVTRSGGPGRYVLPMASARARAARALRALRTGLGDVDVTLDVETLARWLEQFHPRSWVELDLRPVAALVGGEDGVEDVRLGLESLTVGDAAGVAAAYQLVSRRSHHLELLSVSS